MLDALLLVVLPLMPLAVSSLGFIGEVVVLVHYSNGNYKVELIRTLVFMLLPILVLLLSTLSGIEKASYDDPSIVKKNIVVRALYYAFHIKMFHVYLKTVANAAIQIYNPERENTSKNVYEATMIRRYLAFVGLAPQLVNQLYIIFLRFVENDGLTNGDDSVLFAISVLVLSLGCSLALHHCTDKMVDFEAHWSVPKRFISTLVIYTWKLLLVTGRAMACALFIYQFDAFVVFPVMLHGVFVLALFVAGTRLRYDGFTGFLKHIIICYCQMFDINDVYVNENNGKTTVIIVYYIFRLLGDAALLVPFIFFTKATSPFKVLVVVIPFVFAVCGIVVRLIYYSLLHPKWR